MGEKDLIWTKHALSRAKERGIKQSDVWATWRHPDNERYATSQKAWIYYRKFGNKKIEVVVAKNEKGQNIVVSVWSREIGGTQNKGLFVNLLKKIFGL